MALPSMRSQTGGNFSVLLDDGVFEGTQTLGDLGLLTGGAAGGGETAGGIAAAGSHGKSGAVYFGDMAKPERLIDTIKDQFAFTFSWEVPAPLAPRAPLIYVPRAVRDAFKFPQPQVSHAELDAMALGLLDMIPLAPHMLQPNDARAFAAMIAESDAAFEAKQSELKEKNVPLPLVTDPRVKNPQLTEEDFALIDVDFARDAMEDRTLPSLALLQKPIYTEMNQETLEERARARVNRVREKAGAAPETPRRHRRAVEEEQYLSKFTANTERTFRNSLQLEADFEAFLDAVAEQRLGISHEFLKDQEGVLLARLLFRHLSLMPQQAQTAVLAAVATAARCPSDDLDELRASCSLLVGAYTSAVSGSAASPSSGDSNTAATSPMATRLSRWATLYAMALARMPVDKRLALLRGTPESGRPVSLSEMFGEVSRSNRLIKPTVGVAASPTSRPVPLAVLPVFPSGYADFVASRKHIENPSGAAIQLAKETEGLTHICVHNQRATAPAGDASSSAPFILMETKRGAEVGAALLTSSVSEETAIAGEPVAPPEVQPGGTAKYSLNVHHQFTPIMADNANKLTYVFNVMDEAVVYDRIDKRTHYQRNTATRTFRQDGHFVLVWEGGPHAGEQVAGQGVDGDDDLPEKRPRNE